MPSLAASRRLFLERYRKRFPQYKSRAELVEKFLSDALRDRKIDIHKIEARAKTPESVHLKLLRKKYRRPESQLTDKVGARIITYYATDVDKIVAVLRDELRIDRRKSVDKRRTLGTRSFGYSSVHLIATLNDRNLKKPEYAPLSRLRFELQIRSILEHAWAEIEHEVVFKSGVVYPEEIDREFASVAGTLEILGKIFISLKDKRNSLIESHRRRYAQGLDVRAPFDAARLLAFLEYARPNGKSWRTAEGEGLPFPPLRASKPAASRPCVSAQ